MGSSSSSRDGDGASARANLSRIFIRRARQADQRQHFLDAVGDVVAVGALAAQAVGHVLGHRQVGKQRVRLEQDAVVARLRFGVRDVAPGQHDGAAVLALEAGDGAQQGGLAAARGAQQAHQLPGADVERDVRQRGVAAKALHQMPDREKCGIAFGHGASGLGTKAVWKTRIECL